MNVVSNKYDTQWRSSGVLGAREAMSLSISSPLLKSKHPIPQEYHFISASDKIVKTVNRFIKTFWKIRIGSYSVKLPLKTTTHT